MIRKMLCLLLVLMFAVSMSSCSLLASREQTGGFKNEDDAIEYFISELKEGDIDGALEACSFDLMAEGFDYEKQSKELEAIPPVSVQSSSQYDLGVKLNRAKYEYILLNQLTAIVFQLNAEGGFTGALKGKTTSVDKIEDVIKCFNQTVWAEVELVVVTTQDVTYSEKYLDTMKEQAQIFGAQNKDYRTVIYKYKGEYYKGGFSLLQYNDLWYIMDLSDPFSGIGQNGMLILVDEDEYKKYLN